MDNAIKNLIDRFVSGVDVSKAISGDLEVLLDNAYPDDDYVQETVVMLAMYAPGGGEFLYNTAEIVKRLNATLAYVKRIT